MLTCSDRRGLFQVTFQTPENLVHACNTLMGTRVRPYPGIRVCMHMSGHGLISLFQFEARATFYTLRFEHESYCCMENGVQGDYKV